MKKKVQFGQDRYLRVPGSVIKENFWQREAVKVWNGRFYTKKVQIKGYFQIIQIFNMTGLVPRFFLGF